MALFIPAAGGVQGPAGPPGAPGAPGVCVTGTFAQVEQPFNPLLPINTVLGTPNDFPQVNLLLVNVNSNPAAAIVNPFVLIPVTGTYEVRFQLTFGGIPAGGQVNFILNFGPLAGPKALSSIRTTITSPTPAPNNLTPGAAGYLTLTAGDALGIAAEANNAAATSQTLEVIAASIFYLRVA